MALRTIHQAMTNTKRTHTKTERRACRGKIKQYTRSVNMAGNIALKRNASAKRQCSTAWNARAVPHPGHFNPVSAKKGQRGKNHVTIGSTQKNSATPDTKRKNIPAGAARRRTNMADPKTIRRYAQSISPKLVLDSLCDYSASLFSSPCMRISATQANPKSERTR